MIIKQKDIIDILTQMYDDMIELYDGETINSFVLRAAIDVFKGRKPSSIYWANIL